MKIKPLKQKRRVTEKRVKGEENERQTNRDRDRKTDEWQNKQTKAKEIQRRGEGGGGDERQTYRDRDRETDEWQNKQT